MIVKDHKRILSEEKQEEKKENINTDIPKDLNTDIPKDLKSDIFKDSSFLWLLLLYAFTTGFGGSNNNVPPYLMQPPTNVNIYIDSKKESCKCEQN